jgi:hypothetical protein
VRAQRAALSERVHVAWVQRTENTVEGATGNQPKDTDTSCDLRDYLITEKRYHQDLFT